MDRGGRLVDEMMLLKYPSHQHMVEWYLFSGPIKPESKPLGLEGETFLGERGGRGGERKKRRDFF
jgi:hypothetical protein